jgi:hypothetical protein
LCVRLRHGLAIHSATFRGTYHRKMAVPIHQAFAVDRDTAGGSDL